MPTIRDIQAAVAARYGVSVLDLLSARQGNEVLWPRHVAIWCARHHTPLSLVQIGQAFGGRHHTTVMHALDRVELRIRADATAATEVQGIVQAITNKPTLRLVA
jgi:chromosomal replication initiator protein